MSKERHTLRFVLLASLLAASGPAAGEGIERSRGALLEVHPFATTTMFKHNSTLNRVDTDTYPVELFHASRASSGVRYYLAGNQIKRIGSSADTLSTFTTYTPPAGMEPRAAATCGSRVCIVFQGASCSSMQIGGFAPGQEPIWSQLDTLEIECVRDMTSQAGQPIVVTQVWMQGPQLHQTRFHRYDTNLGLIEGNRLGPQTEHVVHRIAKHYGDANSIFLLSTNGGPSRIWRASVTTGAPIAHSDLFDGEITFTPEDIANYPASRELILLKHAEHLRQYDLVGFDQSTLAFKRTRRFSY